MVQGEAGFAKLLKRALTGIADFRGRSRRLEAVYYFLASTAATLFLTKLLMEILPFPDYVRVLNLARLVIFIPWFALLARRLHDQNKSGWLALFLPAVFVCVGMAAYVSASADPLANGDAAAPFYWFGVASALLVVVLFLLPGTKGPNRYGDDPRF